VDKLLKALEATISPEQKEKELSLIRQEGFDGEPHNSGISLGTFVSALDKLATNYQPLVRVK
jgi:signal transduction protein with GAF and PtsI domain